MLFVGDVAIAPGDRMKHECFPQVLLKKPLCLNLEGAVGSMDFMLDWGVCNSSAWYRSFDDFSLGPIFLGNNHIHDLPRGIETTFSHLKSLGLHSFGAGANEAAACAHVITHSGDSEYVLIGAGWPVIGCVPAVRSGAGVNRFDGEKLRRSLDHLHQRYQNGRIVVVLHWNYEFERYPQPGHRRLAMDLIDDGAYTVIGHHPHIVGPVERYHGRTIAYSIGNWAFSYGKFFNGRLRFPESSFDQIAIELGSETDTVHHARFSPPTTVTYQFSEEVDSPSFSLKAEFEGFDHSEYMRWFKRHRLKRKLLPIYREPDASIGNWLRDRWVAGRQILIDTAVKRGLKSMRRSP